jgi:hypothetical protein
MSQPVVIGFVVKMQWKEGAEQKERTRDKIVSRLFSSRGAADIFKEAAEKNERVNPTPNKRDVKFFVTNDIGVDNLPQGI